MNNEWYTPPCIIDKVYEVLGHIDMDPASNDIAQETVLATTYHTQYSNGLLYPWDGQVWCNPPYDAKNIKAFTKKFAEEYENGNMQEGIILTNSGTDTLWNQNIAKYLQAYTIGRISFLQPDGTEKGKGGRGQVFTYVGNNREKFIKVFKQDKFCWIPNDN